MADNGVSRVKTYNEGIKITFGVGSTGDVVKCRFVKKDSGVKTIQLGEAGDSVFDTIGVVDFGAGVKNGHLGTDASPYTAGDDVTVITAGTCIVDVAVTATEDPAYINDGDAIIVGADGKAVKFTAPSALGDNATGAEIMAYIAAYNAIVGRAIGNPDSSGKVTVKLFDN